MLDQDVLKGLLFAAKMGTSLVQPLFKVCMAALDLVWLLGQTYIFTASGTRPRGSTSTLAIPLSVMSRRSCTVSTLRGRPRGQYSANVQSVEEGPKQG